MVSATYAFKSACRFNSWRQSHAGVAYEVSVCFRAAIANLSLMNLVTDLVFAKEPSDALRVHLHLSGNFESFEETSHGEVVLTPERVLMDKQALNQLIQGLYALPERTRHIFVLYHFENIRQTEIAARFDMPISTVEKHMARANNQLLKRLGRKR